MRIPLYWASPIFKIHKRSGDLPFLGSTLIVTLSPLRSYDEKENGDIHVLQTSPEERERLGEL